MPLVPVHLFVYMYANSKPNQDFQNLISKIETFFAGQRNQISRVKVRAKVKKFNATVWAQIRRVGCPSIEKWFRKFLVDPTQPFCRHRALKVKTLTRSS